MLLEEGVLLQSGTGRPDQLRRAKPGEQSPGRIKKEEKTMRYKRAYIWAYLDGKKLVEVIQAALDNNMTVDEMKALLIKENPRHEVTFKIIRK